MSVMMNAFELQIWDNAAFDNGESEVTNFISDSWSNIQAFESIDSEMEKENHSSVDMVKSPVSFNTPILVKPLHPNNHLGNRTGRDSINCVPAKQSLVSPAAKRNEFSVVRDDEQIDKEIETVEKEINKLRMILQKLKWEKAGRNRKSGVRFLEQRQGSRNLVQLKKLEDSVLASAGVATSGKRRGFSLGPAEIMSAGEKTRQMMISRMEVLTPLNQKQNRRKSCFWKLDQIDELKAAKESLSSSPKSKKAISKLPREAMTTVKKTAKRDDSVNLSSVQPKKLFKEGEKTVKKPVRAGRVVASRYNCNNQAIDNTTLRKRSLNVNGEFEGNERKRASIGAKSCGKQGMQQQIGVKKRWEIPREVVVYKSSDCVDDDDENLLPSVAEGLPKIRTMKYVAETPRDSGAVKRVAELEGKKSVFGGVEEEGTAWVRQALSLTEEDDEE